MNRNYKTLVIFVITILLFSSCALRVNKDITKFYSPQFPDDNFKIYYYSLMPENAEIIGTISIMDGGMTMTCDLATVLNLAKIEAGQAGGNGLLITKHTKPSAFGSSCHQISAMILKIPDSPTVTNTDEDWSQGVVSSAGNTVDTTKTKTKSATKMIPFEIPRYLPKMIFSLDGGYGWKTARINPNLTPDQKEFIEHLSSGFVWNASAAYIFENSYAIKLTYLQYLTSYITEAYDKETHQTGTYSTKQTISYVGPTVARYDVFGKDKNWFVNYYVGLGYMMFYSNETFRNDYYTATGSTLGAQFGLGLEHKIYPELGIGLNAELITGVLTVWEEDKNGYKQTISTNDINSGVGLGQFRIMVGIRYYINKKNPTVQPQ
jgi:hypothetical protein